MDGLSYQKEYFDKKAVFYDRATIFGRKNRNHLKKIEKMAQLLDLRSGYQILEIGVGTGIHAEYLLEHCPGIFFVGVDLSSEMLKQTQRRLEKFDNILLKVDNGEELHFADRTFDAVYMSDTLHHFCNPQRGVQELIRVLKPGKKFVIMEANPLFFKIFINALLNKVDRNALRMTETNLRLWLREQRVRDMRIENFIYTLPAPRFLFSLYDRIDNFFCEIPILSRFSVMIYATGKK